MRRHPRRYLATVVAVAAVLAGCSNGGGSQPGSAAPHPSPGAQQPAAGRANEGPIGVSAGGVTTTIDVPAESTEEQYAQACRAAKEWMDTRGGENPDLVEPFLKDLQGSATSGPATFNQTWAQLSTPQQAAVIIAVRAAASGGCS